MADHQQGSDLSPEEDKEFQIREQVRLRVEAQIQDELNKIKQNLIFYKIISNQKTKLIFFA